MVGVMAVHSCTRRDPPLNELPYGSFAHFAAQHLLQGSMIDPMDRLRDQVSSELLAEINNVVAILSREVQRTVEAFKLLQMDIQALGLDDESDG